MTDITDDYEAWDDYDEPRHDDWDYEPDPMEGYERTEPDWEAQEHYRREAMSPLGRLAEDLRLLARRYARHLRSKVIARQAQLTGHATQPDEPPF